MGSPVDGLLKRAFRDMDPSTGMFPESWRCSRCNKVLNEDGGHPAELYAGTWNSLCYPCTGAGPYVRVVAVLDGALTVSWPPHCPSWRRSREEFWAYTDCENCKGLGATRGYANWSHIWDRCKPCSDRYYGHPERVWLSSREDRLAKAASARFEKLLDRTALASLGVRKASRKRINEAARALPEEDIAATRAVVMAVYDKLKARLAVHAKRIREVRAPDPAPKSHRLVWTPIVRSGGYPHDGKPEILVEGSLEECKAAWVVEVLARRCAHLTDPNRYQAQGLLAKEGVLNAVHIIGAGTLQLHSPESKRP